jgi:hypothetical protein
MKPAAGLPVDDVSRRKHTRVPVDHRSRLLHSTGAPQSLIIDISAGGAKIRLDRDEVVSGGVVLVDLVTGHAFTGAVAWRKDLEVGVRFTTRHDLRGLVPGHLRIAKSFWLSEGEAPPPPPTIQWPLPPGDDTAEPPPPPEPTEAQKASAALIQSFRSRLAAESQANTKRGR